MGERPEPLNGIYRGKTRSQGFVQTAEPPAQNVDERRAQGFNLASLTTNLNPSLHPLRQPFLNACASPFSIPRCSQLVTISTTASFSFADHFAPAISR